MLPAKWHEQLELDRLQSARSTVPLGELEENPADARAVGEVHLSQSALSHQIRQLEQELGTPLFERTSRLVTPTEAGEVIAARARRVPAEVDGAREEVDELRGVLRGRIWIGALLPAGELDVPGLLAGFSRAHPGIEVGLREGIAADMLRFLAAGELDAAFCLLGGEVPDELAFGRLGHDEVVAAFAPGRAPPVDASAPPTSPSIRSSPRGEARPSPPRSTSCSPMPGNRSASRWRAATLSCCARSPREPSPRRSFLATPESRA